MPRLTLTLNVLGVREDDAWCAIALDMSLQMATGWAGSESARTPLPPTTANCVIVAPMNSLAGHSVALADFAAARRGLLSLLLLPA